MNAELPPVCDYEGSDYQESFWEQGGRDYEDRVEAVALRRLLPEKGKLLLELGAGAGRNTPRYSGFQRVVLLDFSLTQLQRAKQSLGNDGSRYTYVAANIYRLPFVEGLFDGATMIRTLHHLAEPVQALAQVRRTLLPGACFVLEYANKHNIKAILRYIFRRQSWSPFSPEAVEFVELNFDFHPKTVRAWLQNSGFRVERQLTVSHFRMGLLKRFVPLPILVALDSLAQYSGDWWQLTPSVFTKNLAVGRTAIAQPETFFCCPQCGSADLGESQARFVCNHCLSEWAITDGIYDFRQPVGV